MSRLTISELDPRNIHESLVIREKVFIQEQAVPYDLEIDGLDDSAAHFLGRVDGEAVATARTRLIEPGLAKIERVSVLEDHRGSGYGRLVMQHIIESMDSKGVAKLTLESQTQAQKFYESLGFLAVGEEFMDAGIPHVKMVQVLDQEKAAELGSDKRSYVLNEYDNQSLKATFEEVATLLDHEDGITKLALFLKDQNPLSKSMAEQVNEFSISGNDIGAFLVKGFEMPYLVGSAESERYAEYLLLAVATSIGLPYGFKNQDEGVIISDITPRKSDADNQLGTGVVDGLEWHTEDAHAQYNCDIIALYGLRGDPEAKTLISQVDPNTIPSTVVTELLQPQFYIFSDASHEDKNGIESPVLKIEDSNLKLRYDPLYTDTYTPNAKAALSDLTDWINGNHHAFTVNSTEMLLVDNRTSVHARSKFTPRYDGTDRWLKRLRVYQTNVPEEHLVAERPLIINI